MQWSKLRSLFHDHLAPELNGRIDVHSAAYKSGGRTWISFDGEEIACVQAPGFTQQVFRHSTCTDLHNGQTLELGDAIYQLVHTSIDACVTSDNPLVRAVAILDRRFGKKRVALLAADDQQTLPSMQAALLAARMVANGKPPNTVICEHCNEPLVHIWKQINPQAR